MKKYNEKGYKLLEIIATLVIVGILASIAVPNFRLMRENALEKEAKKDLKQIISAERIYKIETGGYFVSSGADAVAHINSINTNLQMALTTAGNRGWNFYTNQNVGQTNCCAEAVRVVNTNTKWAFVSIDPGSGELNEEPVSGSCAANRS